MYAGISFEKKPRIQKLFALKASRFSDQLKYIEVASNSDSWKYLNAYMYNFLNLWTICIIWISLKWDEYPLQLLMKFLNVSYNAYSNINDKLLWYIYINDKLLMYIYNISVINNIYYHI